MAAGGLKPFCAIYSTFLQRGYDQIVHDVALQKLPVRFAIDRAGLVGADGATHAGSFDIAYLSNLPGFVVMAASDELELMHMIRTSAEYNEGPISFRFPRGEGVGITLPERGEVLEIGKGKICKEGNTVAILSFGAHLKEAIDASEELEQLGISVTIADARFAKPLDIELIKTLAENHELLITLEEGSIGGFGSHVVDWLLRNNLINDNLKVKNLFLPDKFIDQASPDVMYKEAGLDAAGITKTILDSLGIADIRSDRIKIIK